MATTELSTRRRQTHLRQCDLSRLCDPTPLMVRHFRLHIDTRLLAQRHQAAGVNYVPPEGMLKTIGGTWGKRRDDVIADAGRV